MKAVWATFSAAQVVQLLVEHGFVGSDKWRNMIFVGTKADRATAPVHADVGLAPVHACTGVMIPSLSTICHMVQMKALVYHRRGGDQGKEQLQMRTRRILAAKKTNPESVDDLQSAAEQLEAYICVARAELAQWPTTAMAMDLATL